MNLFAFFSCPLFLRAAFVSFAASLAYNIDTDLIYNLLMFLAELSLSGLDDYLKLDTERESKVAEATGVNVEDR